MKTIKEEQKEILDLYQAEENECAKDNLERRYRRLTEQIRDANAIADMLGNYVNRYHDARPIIDALNLKHRTLQQGVFGLFMSWVKSLSKLEDGWYDLRNEASVKMAKQIYDKCGGEYIDSLPLI